jgi:putative ABC transport system permease protein
LPVVGLVVGPGPLLVAPLVGLLVTLLAGLAPAIRATRVAPIEALAESRGATARRGRVLPSIGGALLAGAVGILSYGLLGDPGSIKARLLLVAVGSLLLFVSTAMLAPLLVPPLVRLMQIPLRVGGVSGVIAGENARRQPGRTAATSAALMIGLALVAFMAIFANGVTKMIDRSYDRSLAADYMISSSSYGATMDAAVAGRVARAPGIAEVTQIRRDVARIEGGSRHQAFGVDPGTIGQLYRFEWDRGSAATLASLGSHGVLVERTIARSEHLRVGSRLTLTTPIGRRAAFTVKGIYHDEVLLAGLMLPLSTYRDAFGQRDDSYVLASARSGADVETTRAALRRVLAGYTGLKVDTHASLRQANHADGQNIVTLFDALLALSILISVFGIVNTLALSVLERQRELGLLRAVGASRRQVRRMVRYESILTAWIGATLGLVLGVFLAWMVIKAVGQGLEFSPPLGSLAIHAAFATVVGVLAAVLPARRAARTDVLVALAYE